MKKIQGSRFKIQKFQIFLMFFMSAVYCLLSIVSTSHASTVDEVVGRIQKIYGEIKEVQGKFSQTSYIKDLDKIERYEGEFFIKKPSSIRWNFSKPRDEEIIIKENDIWIYKKSEKQALKSAFNKDAYNHVPIALLNNFGDLKNNFDIKLIKDDTLELTPKRRMGFINKLLLEINSTDFPVKTFSVFDVYGNKINITIKNVKINSGLEDSIFTFKLQPGVEIFDLNQ